MSDAAQQPVIRYYFVDEAGDPMLFNRKKQVIVGIEGSSAYFILGKVDVDNPTAVAAERESTDARCPRKRIAGGYRSVRGRPHGMEPSFVRQLV